MKPNETSQLVIGAAMKVHTVLGPGILESAYDACLFYELTKTGLHFEHQVTLPIVYERVQLATAYRVDFIVEDLVIIEVKSVERMNAIFETQLLTYLRLADKRVGLLINFNSRLLKDGITRRVL